MLCEEAANTRLSDEEAARSTAVKVLRQSPGVGLNSKPASGASVTSYGYGGTDTLVAKSFSWGATTQFLRNGDSGGPVINSAGEIVAVNSASGGGLPDVFALVGPSKETMEDQIKDWEIWGP